MALVEAYKAKCASLNIKPNSRFVTSLPPEKEALTVLDLTDNMVGPTGLLAVAEVVRVAPCLVSVVLRGNKISSPPVKELAAVLKEHKAVTRVDLSDNDVRLAGPDLVDLLKRNNRIVELNIEGTHLRPLFVNLIALQLKRNKDRVSGKKASLAPGAEKTRHEEEETLMQAEQKKAEDGLTDQEKKEHQEIAPQQPDAPGSRKSSKASAAAPKEEKEPAAAAEAAPEAPKAAEEAGKKDGPEPAEKDAAAQPEKAGSELEVMTGFQAFGMDEGEAADGDDSFADMSPRDSPINAESATYPQSKPEDRKQPGARRATVCAEQYTEEQIDSFTPECITKEEPVAAFLDDVLNKHQLFNHLDDKEMTVVVNALKECPKAKDDVVFEEGDEDMDIFYIIKSGEVTTKEGAETKSVLKEGDAFGEVFLLYPQPASQTVVVTSDTAMLYACDRGTFKFILNQASKKKRAMYETFLQRVPFLSTLTHLQLLQLADALKASCYEDGQPVIKYGEEGHWLHIVVEGSVEVIGRDENDEKVKVCQFVEGDCVGELEFLNNHKTVADVIASGKVRTAKMNRRHFEMCMGPVVDILRKNAAKLEVYAYYRETLAKIAGDTKDAEVAKEETKDAGRKESNPGDKRRGSKPDGKRRESSKSEEAPKEQEGDAKKRVSEQKEPAADAQEAKTDAPAEPKEERTAEEQKESAEEPKSEEAKPEAKEAEKEAKPAENQEEAPKEAQPAAEGEPAKEEKKEEETETKQKAEPAAEAEAPADAPPAKEEEPSQGEKAEPSPASEEVAKAEQPAAEE